MTTFMSSAGDDGGRSSRLGATDMQDSATRTEGWRALFDGSLREAVPAGVHRHEPESHSAILSERRPDVLRSYRGTGIEICVDELSRQSEGDVGVPDSLATHAVEATTPHRRIELVQTELIYPDLDLLGLVDGQFRWLGLSPETAACGGHYDAVGSSVPHEYRFDSSRIHIF